MAHHLEGAAPPSRGKPNHRATPLPTPKPGAGKTARPTHSGRDLAVDVVEVAGGPALHGLVLNRESRGEVVLAVERAWLAQADPPRFQHLAESEQATAQQAWTELRQRLQAWHAQTDLPAGLAAYVESEQKRAAAALVQLAEGPAPQDSRQFLLIELPLQQVQRIQPATPENRQRALLGWRENLDRVSSRPGAELEHELKSLGFQPDSEQVNLSERLPLRLQSDREWLARKAILTFVHHKSLEFQGTPARLYRTGNGVPPVSPARLLAETLQSQLQRTLEELVEPGRAPGPEVNAPFPPGTLATCRQEAKRLSLWAYRATSIVLDAEGRRGRVHSRFDLQVGPQEWLTIWQASREGGGGGLRDNATRQRLREDPQVQAILRGLKEVGLAGEDAIDAALDMGLATQQSLSELDTQFQLFLGHYGVHAEGPPLFLPDSSPRQK